MANNEMQSYFDKNKGSKVLGFGLLALSLLLFFSIFSYIIYFRTDQSLAIGGWSEIKKIEYYQTQNWINKIGLFFGYFFVDSLYGLFSFLVPYFLFIISINYIFQKRIFSILKNLGNILLTLFFGCSFASLFQINLLKFINIPLGGALGNYVAGKEGLLYSNIGFIGILVLLSIMLWLVLTLLYDFNIQKFSFSNFTKKSNNTTDAFIAENKKTEEEEPKKHYDTLFEMDNIEIATIPSAETSKDQPTIQFDIVEEEEEIGEQENPKIEIVAPSIELDFDFEEHEIIEEEKPEEPLPFELIEIAPEKEVSNADELIQERFENLPPYDPRKELSMYQFPSIDLMENHGNGKAIVDKDQLEQNKNQIIKTLNDFNITITSIRATVGPTVTLYEITPSAGVRISKIKNLEDDIALALAALGIRIIAPIPGKGTIGIEVPNIHKQIVSMKSVIQSEKFQSSTMELPLALGKNISNEVFVADLAKMPHLLMAGATGKGKSVGINSILISLLYKKHPSELKFVLVDPKKVELSIYSTIEKHYLAKLPNEEDAIITDVRKVVNTLNSLCIEMDDRYDLLKKAQVRNLKEYNEKFVARKLNPLNGHKFLPYFVLIIDEFADLIMTAGKEVELPIARLAQLARAVGIHLIVATQRPSVNVITGLIKANFPARISFAVSSAIDSKTILDTKGAEQLIGQGDMLLSLGSELIRLQCAFIDTPEVDRIGKFINKQQGFGGAYDLPEYYGEDEAPQMSFEKKDLDELFVDAAREIVLSQMGSISLIQRKLSLGHNRAGRIIDQLEAFGVVGPNKGSKPREVYFKSLDELERHLETLR
jgi:S-DNA-T family DNA segregation ATPase FtsK/SpoIIIE